MDEFEIIWMTSSEFITQHFMFDFKKQQEILQQLIKEVNFATLTSVSGNCGCFGGPQLSDRGGQHHTTPSLMFAIHLYLAFILQLLKLFFIQFISTNSHNFFHIYRFALVGKICFSAILVGSPIGRLAGYQVMESQWKSVVATFKVFQHL